MTARSLDEPTGADTSNDLLQDLIDPPTAAIELANRAGALRDEVGLLRDDVEETHRSALQLDRRTRAAEAAKKDPHDLLKELSDNYGMSWTSIGKALAVSIPAIRKWRRGGSISPDNRTALSRLVAFLEVLEIDLGVADPVGWLEMSLPEGSKTGLDLYGTSHATGLLEYAGGHISLGDLLRDVEDADQPSDEGWEVFEAPDGKPAVRLRE